MRNGLSAACELVGFPLSHGELFQAVANQLDMVISSRALGRACTQLVDEGYAMKVFRIDTKSCDWGPMMGFVCMDPRLSKMGSAIDDVAANKGHTADAVSGEIPHHLSHPDPGEGEGWRAGVVPIAISSRRRVRLAAGIVGKQIEQRWVNDNLIRGVARFDNSQLTLLYLLSHLPPGEDPNYGRVMAETWGIFIDPDKGFQQIYAPSVPGVWRKIGGKYHEALLGLANPGSAGKGYKACVTGDYDLFGVWPKNEVLGRDAFRPSATAIAVGASSLLATGQAMQVPAHVDRQWDTRRMESDGNQHFMLGNITRRINLVKVLLNSQLQAGVAAGNGQCVHHSDETGNPTGKLQKSLDKSMPIIVFRPRLNALGIESMSEFAALVGQCRKDGYAVRLRKDWVMPITALLGER